jgi:glycosyltransferase involved in cell wall biosynthesis
MKKAEQGSAMSGKSRVKPGRVERGIEVKVLWVKSNKLLPVHSGGDIRSFNIARQLARRYELTFLSYYDGEPDREYERQLAQHFPGAICVCTGKAGASTISRGVDYLTHLPSAFPYAVGRFGSSEVRQKISERFQERCFDVAICDFLDAAVNFPSDLPVPSVLFQHNVESEIWRRHAATESNPLKRQVYAIEFRKMLRYERRTVRKFHHVIAVSEHDRSLMETWVDGARITVIPTGVDLEQYRPDFSAKPAKPVVMFVGAMDWDPNVDAMEFFCHEIWPLVLAQTPDAQLRIVGRNPRESVQKLASRSVQVTGRVPSVVEHLRDAAAVIVPLRIGGGTRLKIYEAMAAGKAVVSTSVGAEGLDVHHGRDIILADDPKSFAVAVLTLLRDENMRHKYERAAAELAAQYDWAVIGDKFGHTLEVIREQFTRTPERLQAGVHAG